MAGQNPRNHIKHGEDKLRVQGNESELTLAILSSLKREPVTTWRTPHQWRVSIFISSILPNCWSQIGEISLNGYVSFLRLTHLQIDTSQHVSTYSTSQKHESDCTASRETQSCRDSATGATTASQQYSHWTVQVLFPPVMNAPQQSWPQRDMQNHKEHSFRMAILTVSKFTEMCRRHILAYLSCYVNLATRCFFAISLQYREFILKLTRRS